jgi:2-C-methyl-D-erythritol 4-phosphate cytidylyltransferase/2-C-methyl-D-erythritol 2,4-cyclodiphosphate synthase
MTFKKCSFILLAGGKGARMESPFKQFRLLGGMPLWAWSFKLSSELYDMGLIGEVIVVFPKGFDFSNEVKIINELNIPFKVNVVEGGETRAISS